jgi:ketosteroid isomerase-like protein
MIKLVFYLFTICSLSLLSQNTRGDEIALVKLDPHSFVDYRLNPGVMQYIWHRDSAFYMSFLLQNDVKTVLGLMKMQQEAWNDGNIDAFMEHYWKNDSLKFIGSRGITYGWQKTLNNYKQSYPDKTAMGMLTFTIKEASQLSPESIYVIGEWQLQKKKPAGGYFTLLWKKIDGRWVIVADHTS